MEGTLSIRGNLATLGKLTAMIEDWSDGLVETELATDIWGGWTPDNMASLLERLHPWQLLLVSFVARAGGRRGDPEVRAKFEIEGSGLRGQTGAISKHIASMKAAGTIPQEASHLLKVDRPGHAATFVIPEELLPIVLVALARPGIEKALEQARAKYFDELA
jgi:hypothetical protein